MKIITLIAKRIILGVPASGDNIIARVPGVRTVYPYGTPMTERPTFNQWLIDVRRGLRVAS